MLDSKLETLLMVSETGSYTRAAERLSLTQPAVSQHIKLLEDDLGVKIFNRCGRELKITPEGELILRYATRMKALNDNLRQNLLDRQRSVRSLTIGVTHTSESNLMPEALARYCGEHGEIHIKMITDTINNLYEKLKTYEIDLAVVEGRVRDEDLCTVLLDTDCLMLAVAPGHPLSQKSMVTLDALKREKLILRLPDSGTRNLFVSHLESNNLSIEDFNVILEVDNIATIKDLIRRNFGVSILARSACLDEYKKGKLALLPVENLSMIREINMVYSRDFPHDDILNGIAHMYYAVSGGNGK